MSELNMKCVLPPEMTDQILDHLHDDPKTLGACSLTCQAWVTSAQSHLFHRVWLGMTYGVLFSRLLETSPHIAQYVKILEIEEGQDRFEGEPKFVEAVIPLIAPKLTNLEELSITCVIFYELNPSAQTSLLQNFPSLRSLSLFSSVFGTFHDFTSFLVSHPSVEKLELQDSGWEADTEASPDDTGHAISRTSGPHLHLRTISLSFPTSTSRIIDWLVSTHPTLHLTNIHIPNLRPEDAPAVSRLFHSLGPSIKHLEIGLSPLHNRENAEEVFRVVSVSSNTSLRTLCFVDLVVYSLGQGRTRAAWVPIVLSQVTSAATEEIAFRVYFNEADELGSLDLERIDEILSRSLFNGLKKVLFWLYGSGDHADGGKEIKRRMKGLDDRGLLVFK